MRSVAYVGLGSNMGDRKNSLCAALTQMAEMPTTVVEQVSSIYETAPWGLLEQPAFLNCVAKLATRLKPNELLRRLLDIETCLGRKRDLHWGPRVIDLDLLLYDAVNIASDFLTLPHPLMAQRLFVLVPLVELDAEVKINEVSASEHLLNLSATSKQGEVVLWGPALHQSEHGYA